MGELLPILQGAILAALVGSIALMFRIEHRLTRVETMIEGHIDGHR